MHHSTTGFVQLTTSGVLPDNGVYQLRVDVRKFVGNMQPSPLFPYTARYTNQLANGVFYPAGVVCYT